MMTRGALLSAARARGVGAGGGDRAADPAGRRRCWSSRCWRCARRASRRSCCCRSLVTAAVVDAWLARSWASLRRLLAGGGGARRARGRLDRRSGSAPARGRSAATRWSPARRTASARAAKYVVYHLASVLILCGLFPAAAVAVLLVRALRAGRAGPARARVPGRRVVADRLARARGRRLHLPLLGPDRRAEPDRARAGALRRTRAVARPRARRGRSCERGVVAAVAAPCCSSCRSSGYVNVFGTHDAMTMIPLYKLVQASSPGTMLTVYLVVRRGGGGRVRAAARGGPCGTSPPCSPSPRRARRSVAEPVRRRPGARAAADVPRRRPALDRPRRRTGRSHTSTTGSPPGTASGRRSSGTTGSTASTTSDAAEVPGPLPQTPAEVQPDGTVFVPSSARQPGDYAVVSTWVDARRGEVEGSQAAGPDPGRARLWRAAAAASVPRPDLGPAGERRHLRHDHRPARSPTTATTGRSGSRSDQGAGDHRHPGRTDRLVARLDVRARPARVWHGDFPVDGPRTARAPSRSTPTGLVGTTYSSSTRFDRA